MNKVGKLIKEIAKLFLNTGTQFKRFCDYSKFMLTVDENF